MVDLYREEKPEVVSLYNHQSMFRPVSKTPRSRREGDRGRKGSREGRREGGRERGGSLSSRPA